MLLFCTVEFHPMVYGALSAIMPVVAVDQLPINILVVGKRGNINL